MSYHIACDIDGCCNAAAACLSLWPVIPHGWMEAEGRHICPDCLAATPANVPLRAVVQSAIANQKSEIEGVS